MYRLYAFNIPLFVNKGPLGQFARLEYTQRKFFSEVRISDVKSQLYHRDIQGYHTVFSVNEIFVKHNKGIDINGVFYVFH